MLLIAMLDQPNANVKFCENLVTAIVTRDVSEFQSSFRHMLYIDVCPITLLVIPPRGDTGAIYSSFANFAPNAKTFIA
jgi:hypothetical protein